jgi:hypothetical protein
MVTGFAGGDWNGFENYYMVRNRHAHAWCELFDPDTGWIRVDPTPGSTLTDGSMEAALAGGRMRADRTWQAYLDSLRVLWFRRVIQFDGEDQQLMAESVKGAGLRGMEWVRATLKNLRERFRRDLDLVSTEGSWTGMVRDFLMPAAVLVLLLALGFLARRRARNLAFEEIIRRQAGRLLRQRSQRGLPEDDPDHAEVQLIRYGPVAGWPDDPKRRLVLIARGKARKG